MTNNNSSQPTVAVIGAGISGLSAAHALRSRARVTLFESEPRLGGHAHSVEVTLEGRTAHVDTGFLVFNRKTYPGLTRLLEELAVPTSDSEMSFSVQVPQAASGKALEWCGSDLASVFCQPGNLLRPAFWRMLAQLVRFNALATRLARAGQDAELDEPLGAFLDRHGFGPEFRNWYLLPMTACIWSCPTDAMLRFPVGTMIRFCHNHGLLQLTGRPQWQTVEGGSRNYVQRIAAQLSDVRRASPVRRVLRDASGAADVVTEHGIARFDQVVLATHPDQALALLADADPTERELLGAIRYQPNQAVLHTDASVLPRRRRAWAAWNYEAGTGEQSGRVCLHYLINRLQPLPWEQPVIVSLNPLRPIAPAHVLGQYAYDHPVFDAAALHAQSRLHEIQGRRGTWFCGAWTGYGFHEDGLSSGQAAAAGVLRAQAGPAQAPAAP